MGKTLTHCPTYNTKARFQLGKRAFFMCRMLGMGRLHGFVNPFGLETQVFNGQAIVNKLFERVDTYIDVCLDVVFCN